jgi:PAS domain S-box-containing protein
MDTEQLAREIEKANRKMVELRRAARAESAPKWSEKALAELSSALEELKVVEEELVSQNADLADAVAQSGFERQRYAELFLSSPYGQLLTDLQGVVVESNRTAAALVGVPAEALVGRSMAMAIAPSSRDAFVRWLQELADAARDASVCVHCGGTREFHVLTRPSGQTVPVEIIAAPLSDRFGRIDSIRWCLRDITDREEARRVHRLSDEARRKDEFLAVLGHELRNPLAAIALASDILTAAADAPERKRWAAEVVKRHADQLNRLVEDLLDVSRVSHGKVTLHPAAVDLREVLSAAMESSQSILDSKRHQVVITVPDEPVEVTGDAARLRQVMANLVDNAGKYTPSGGRIAIALRREGERAIFEVQDSGIGLAPSMLERIFGQYEQVEGAAELRQRGLGLGLALVRQLVGMHGGRVQASSAGEGKGSTFRVELPANSESPVAGSVAANAEAGTLQNGRRVLIVDDNVDAAELLAERLRLAGYAVDAAFDGEGALAAARQGQFLAALVDLGLPDMDGFEVCRRLKAEQPALRVIALTGYSDSGSREQAKEAGFERFLVKPLDSRQVVATLAELFAREGS